MEALPTWDLADLYPAPDSPAVEADFAKAEQAARAFAAAHQGKLAAMSGGALAAAIAEYERIEEVLGRLMSYAQLLFAGDSTNAEIGRFYQTVSERVTAISSHLLFFTLELNRLDEAALEQKLADPALAHWRPWLRDLRVFRPHQLSDELEKLLHEKEVTGRSRLEPAVRRDGGRHARSGRRRGPDGQRRAEQAVGPRPLGARGRRRARSARRSAAISGCSRWSPTRWRRTRRSSTRGGTIRAPAATATAPTWWRTRSSMRWCRRCGRIFRGWRIATT